MKKSVFFVVNGKRVFSNFVIAFVVVVVAIICVFGVSYVSASQIVNGAYYAGNQKSNKVSLMINVYWGTEYLDSMLSTLKENDVCTTFFVGGTWAVRESEMLKKIYLAGHEIGNHGYYHLDQAKISTEKNQEEISNTHKIVKELLGVDMNLFAPPSGSYSKKTIEIASGMGYKTIMWTSGKDTIDWRDKDEELIFSRATKNCKGGDLILMHPTSATAGVLDRIVKEIKSKGLEIVPVSENLK